MLTLHKNTETKEICMLVEGKKRIPIYWFPIHKKELRNSVDNLNSFNSEDFRDVHELSKEQANDIFKGLASNAVTEKHQSKYFKVKKYISDELYTTMNISDTKGQFEIQFDTNNTEYTGHILICSGTGGGKTYWAVQTLLKMLKGSKKTRRHVLVISSEWN